MSKSVHCPFCHHDIFTDAVTTLTSCEFEGPESFPTYICDIKYEIYQCSNCGKVFIQEYVSYGQDIFTLESIYPQGLPQVTFDERIEKISPMFIKTYTQALIAESYNLSEIIGLGFRKAFEILVKDYAIFLNPNVENTEILQMALSNVITKYFENTMFKPIFQKITWLGNDYSHTFNKHESYDVQDLKRFIKSCVSMIIAQLDIDELNSIESKNN